MVTELSISDGSLSDLDWFKSIDRILKRAKFDNYYDIYQYEDKGYILGPGSIRGFSFSVSGNSISFKIDSFASSDDWRMFFQCAKDLTVESQGLIYLNGKQDSLINITPNDALNFYKEQMKISIVDTRALIKKSGSSTFRLLINDFTVEVPFDKLPPELEKNEIDWVKLHTYLIEQIDKYGPIQHAKVFNLKTADANLRIANYHHLASIITKECDFISLKGITRSLDGLVKLEKFIEILGHKIIDFGVSYYVPDINFHEEDDLFESLKSIQIAMPEQIIDENQDEFPREDVDSQILKSAIDEIVEQFQSDKSPEELILEVSNDCNSSKFENSIKRMTIDICQIIAKDKSLVENSPKLIDLLVDKGYEKDLIKNALNYIFTKINDMLPESSDIPTKEEEYDDGGGWVILASFIAISVLGALFVLLKAFN